MPLKPLEQKRIYQQVAEQLAELIRSGEYSEGEQLPPERNLAKMLKISRNVVREALLALEIAGYIDIRVGVGTFVVSTAPSAGGRSAFGSFDVGASPTDILAARKAIEGEVAAIAAKDATAEEIATIQQVLDKIKINGEVPSPEADQPREFHEQLVKATHNPLLINIVQQLWEMTRGQLFDNFRHHTRLQESQRRRQEYRQKLLECIKNGDPEGARQAMHAHLDEVATYFFESGVT